MMNDENEQVQNIDAGALAKRLEIVITKASATEVIGTMPVRGNTQPFGLLNGGASMALAETLASVGAQLAAGEGRAAVGIEINGSHHRSAQDGFVTGTATAISVGKTLAIYGVEVCDNEGRKLCTARVTCLLRDLT